MPEQPTGVRAAPAQLGYRRQLDGLRTVAIAVVVAIHTIEALVPSLSGRLLPGGFLGVDLFFVLSGFLITSLLLEERAARGTVDIRRFYGRRALRLLPALAVLLVAHLAWAWATGVSVHDEAVSVEAVVAYVTNFVFAAGNLQAPGLAHLWSLAVEEQFYLVWPIVLVVLASRLSRRGLAAVLVCGIATSTVACALAWSHDPNWRHLYVRTDLRASTLLAGALLAVVWPRVMARARLVRAAAIIGWIVFAAFVVFAHLEDGWVYVWGFTVLGLACAAMIAGAVTETGPFGATLSSPAFNWIGRRSYGLYLWHYPVVIAVADAGALDAWPAAPKVVFAWSVALVATATSYRFVETPFLRLKARLAGRARPDDVVAAYPAVASAVPATLR